MAGVSLAWLLDRERDVVLLESQPTLGGNVQTIQLEVENQIYSVDVGAQYFHPNLYRTYIKLLTILGLYPPALQQSHAFPASITVFNPADYFPCFVSPLPVGRWWPIFAPWNWEGLGAFAVGFGAAKTREDQNADWDVTLETWLQSLGLSRHQWEDILLPWASSLFTGRIDQGRNLSARAAMIFAATAVPTSLLDAPLSYVLNNGLGEAIQRMATQIENAKILTNAKVVDISRTPQHFVLNFADDRKVRVDDLVLACSGPASLRLLNGLSGTGEQQTALAGIEFEETRIAIHTDPAYVPTDPNHRSFLNCQIHQSYCEASMWLNKVFGPYVPQTEVNLWKSWVTFRNQQPTNVLHESTFRHMVPSVATLQAQTRLRAAQGRGGVWIAGGYTYPFDAQETALQSALEIATGLNAISSRVSSLL